MCLYTHIHTYITYTCIHTHMYMYMHIYVFISPLIASHHLSYSTSFSHPLFFFFFFLYESSWLFIHWSQAPSILLTFFSFLSYMREQFENKARLQDYGARILEKNKDKEMSLYQHRCHWKIQRCHWINQWGELLDSSTSNYTSLIHGTSAAKYENDFSSHK